MKKALVIALLAAMLLAGLAGCAAKPASPTEVPSQVQTAAPEGRPTDEELAANLFEAQITKNILASHSNAAENAIFYGLQGDVASSVYLYADNAVNVVENDQGYVLIQCPDSYYEFDPNTMDRVSVIFGMDDVFETAWAELLNGSFEFNPDEDDEILSVTQSGDRTILTISSESAATQIVGWEETDIAPGSKSVCEMEMDAETYLLYDVTNYLEKPDGTRVKVRESHFSYDVTPYQPSEELRQVIDGTEKCITVIADPGTEQERSFTKSCGKNGRLGILSAEGYEKFYQDAACTQEAPPSDTLGEKTIYAAKGR